MITGIGVHDAPESVFTIDWNLCSRSNGIRVHDLPESAGMQFNENFVHGFRLDPPAAPGEDVVDSA